RTEILLEIHFELCLAAPPRRGESLRPCKRLTKQAEPRIRARKSAPPTRPSKGFSAPMLQIIDLTFRIDGRPLFEGASAQIADGWKVGLVGRNGTGKSTLLRIIREEINKGE